jgi:hypothetical protein
MTFRSIVAGVGSSWKLLGSDHAGFPYQLFEVLRNPELAQGIVDTRACLLDPFSKSYLAEFGTSAKELTSPVSLAFLEVLALQCWISISHIECRNGQIRRLKESHDCTWQLQLAQLAARFSLSNARITRAGPFPSTPKRRGHCPKAPKQSKWLLKAKDQNINMTGCGRRGSGTRITHH